MNPIRVLLCSTDEEYLRAFVNFVRKHEVYCARFRFVMFSEVESLKQFVVAQEDFDICLGAAEHLDILKQHGHSARCWLLAMEPEYPNEAKQPAIFAFKPINEILGELQQFMNNQVHESSEQGGEQQTRIIAVSAASGGAGCTTVAAHIAKHWGKHLRVCYVNFESLPVLHQIENPDDPLAIWLYYQRAGREEADQALYQALWNCESLRCQILLPLRHPEDRQQLTKDDIDKLLLTLTRMNEFDFIIVDLPIGVNSMIEAVFHQAHRIVWLLTQDPFGMMKLETCMQETGRLGKRINEKHSLKWLWVYNKSTSKHIDPHEQIKKYVTGESYQLPYMPRWKQAETLQEIWEEPMFERNIASLSSALLET